MPATVASRSIGPAPATSTTAGCRSRPCVGGVVSVPARPNPAAGTTTSASVGLRNVCWRVSTPARSWRAINMPAPGISALAKRPRSSTVTSASKRSVGILERQRETPGLQRAGRRFIGGRCHRFDDGFDLPLRRDVNRQLAARRHRREAHRERLVRGEEVVRQHHRARGDLIGLALRDAVLCHLVDGRRRGERGRQAEHARLGLRVLRIGDRGVDLQFDGLPVGRVGQLEALVDQVQRCAQRAGRGNRPPGRGSRQVRLFAADRAAVDEDDIRGLAGARDCGRCRLLWRRLSRRMSPAMPSAPRGRRGSGRYNEDAPAFVQDISAPMFSHEEYQALHEGATLLDRTADRGRLELRGADRRAYLHGLLTNDVAALSPGAGCYAALLTPQGRMISDMRVSELRDRLFIDLPVSTTEAVRQRLADFIFSEDVEVQDISGAVAQWGLYGPAAAQLVESVMDSGAGAAGDALASVPFYGNVERTFRDRPAVFIRSDDFGVGGFEILIDASVSGLLQQALRRRRCAAHRCGNRGRGPGRSWKAGLRQGHGRDDDSARSGHRGSRDQPDQGVLRRAGDHHPRPAPRSGPGGEAAGRDGWRRGRRAAAAGHASRSRRARDRQPDERRRLAAPRDVQSLSDTFTATSPSQGTCSR